MQKEIQTFLKVRPDWKVAGEWVVAEGSTPNTNLDIPAFLIWSGRAYESLSKQGVSGELPASMVTWLRDQMEKKDYNSEQGYVHPAFSNIFPVSTLPETVIPHWEPWRIIETSDPSRVVAVQPLTLTEVSIPKVMDARLVSASAYVAPRVDPFLMANISSDGKDIEISRIESLRLKLIVSTFWENIATSNARMNELGKTPKFSSSREAAKGAGAVMSEASDTLWKLIQQVSLYSRSLDQTKPFPLSSTSRGVIMLPWIIKAAEAWMQPIGVLAKAGNIELPRG